MISFFITRIFFYINVFSSFLHLFIMNNIYILQLNLCEEENILLAVIL